MDTIKTVRVADLVESGTNPRGAEGFKGEEFEGLVASVKQSGVLMPILVRASAGKKYEIIAGHRRTAAARKAGIEEIPARVVEMTDEQALEAQIVENLQRADIHPLDEAEGYRALVEEGKYENPAAEIALKVGKSETYIRDRMVLTNLTAKAKKAVRAGEMTLGVAALIARLDPDMQKEAVEWALEEWSEVDASDMRKWIQEHVFVDFSNRPWKDDAELVATLEGCAECVGKASANLFGKDAADECTNPKCWAQRMAAYIAKKRKDDPAMLAIFAGYGRSEKKEGVLTRDEYHEITGKEDTCADAEKGIVVEGHGIGRILKICRSVECKTHRSKPGSGSYKATPKEKEKRAKEREAAKAKAEKDAKEVQDGLKKIKFPLSEKHLGVLFDLALQHTGFNDQQPFCKMLGLDIVTVDHKATEYQKAYKTKDYEATLRAYADKGGNAGKLRVIFGLLMPSVWADERRKVLKKI